MSRLIDSALFDAVVDAAVRGTFILLAALAATALMRRASASARHLVWLAALAALLLLPLARGVVPEWRVLPARPDFAAPAARPAAEPPAAPFVSPEADPPSSPVSSTAAEPAPAPFRLPADGRTLALLAWMAGAALLGLRLAYGLARVGWIERRATELTDDGWVRLTDGLARRLGLGRIVRLLREPGATVPMTWGIFRPVILLPDEADGWDDERRRVVLAHELAHVRRWDAATQWIAHLALAVYWFNPLVWLAVRRVRAEREHACDDAVLEIGTRPAEYADHLLSIVRSLGSSQGTATAALAMARRSQFEGRLLAILDGAVRRNGVSRAAGLATAAAALACLVPLAALRPAEGAALPSSPAAPAWRTESDRPAEAGDRDVDASLRDAEAALGGARDTLARRRAALAARLSALEAYAAEAGAEEADAVASTVLTRALVGEGDPGLYAEIIRSALEIESPTDRRLVLFRLLEQPDLSWENVIAIIAATRTMSSDTERRLVITRALEHRAYPASSTVPAALVESLRGFDSATEQRLVLTSLVERPRLSMPSLVSLLRLVPELDDDTERRLVLTTVARRQRVEGDARDAYLAAARSIRNESDRVLALSALIDRTASTSSARTGAAVGTGRGSRAGVAAGALASREPIHGETVWSRSSEHDDVHQGASRRVQFRVRDAIVAEAEPWEVRGFRRGGALVIEERSGGWTRRVEAGCDGAGNPLRRYAVDGEARPFDSAARGWMRSLIQEFAA